MEGNGLRNIVLVGFMGCGKSTVGRELRKRLGYPWIDMDHRIEQEAGKSVSAIFADDGEPGFRDRETDLLKRLLASDTTRTVLSTGGGVVLRPENRDLLKRLGYVVWLDTPVESILERTSRNHSRPLLRTEDPEKRIRTLMREREALYAESAHLRLDTAGLKLDEIVSGILDCARYHFAGEP